MLLTLALLVLLGSILVFFSEEFSKAIKKLFAIKGAKLIIPLFAASWLIYTFDFWVLWAIFYLREILYDVLNFLVRIMPFQTGAVQVVLVFMLTFLSVVPVLTLDFLSRRKTFKNYKHPYLTSGIIWILSVVLLIII
ncbi:Uncharacterised protein [Legionella steigerwaltii]|uniref:Uncharacterized protein n=1 Tax=Legionella steigerwaltii TaxID=460 RepID=A0A378LHN2_9GAMM|nr:hypothetical protein [Legionella steigerwaltii]KTD78991.1 hypothetical protein Lstg_0948 [Legionella steigerwaltii]STY23581.1 Uncharacterised protein [Legionella steigerwaltii]